MFLLLHFLSALLLAIVDAMFICFAIDREERSVGRAEVHQVRCTAANIHGRPRVGCLPPNPTLRLQVYCQLPSVGPLVVNPGGQYQYGLIQGPPGTRLYQPPHPGYTYPHPAAHPQQLPAPYGYINNSPHTPPGYVAPSAPPFPKG